MTVPATYRVTLARAAEYVGGAQALCERLDVPMRELTLWLQGKSTPPPTVFLKAIDIVLVETEKSRFHPSPDDKETKPRT